MLVSRMFRNCDSYIALSVTTTRLQLVNKARNTKLPDHGQYVDEIEEMTDPGSSIKVETYEVFKPIIEKIHILVEYISPYQFILKE